MSGQRHRLKAAPFKDLAGRPAVFFRSKKRSNGQYLRIGQWHLPGVNQSVRYRVRF
jgi:hypothetical protein